MTATVVPLRQARTGGLTATRLVQGHWGAYDHQQVPCPQWDRGLKAHVCVSRTVETMGGPIRFARPSCYDQACRMGHAPFDEARGVVTGCKQLALPQAAACVGTAVPSETAQSLLHALTGRSFGNARMHTVTHQVAEGLRVLEVAPPCDEIKRRLTAVAAERLRRPVVVLGIVEALRWGVAGWHRRTNASAMSGSSVREPGGMKPTALTCWHCAVRNTTGHSIG